MVVGLDKFAERFAGFKDCYIMIGGTASTLVFEDAGLEFRATKDLDIVLCFEALTKEFVTEFWNFVRDGGYKVREASSGERRFYRFQKPVTAGYPYMLELFSRNPGILSDGYEGHLTPIPVGEEVSSLSAILLDDGYYGFLHEHRKELAGVPVVSEVCLIPLKARAWLDLTRREKAGDKINGDDIKKHRNDILRLYQVLEGDELVVLPDVIKQDLTDFLVAVQGQVTVERLRSLKLTGITPDELLERFRRVYGIS